MKKFTSLRLVKGDCIWYVSGTFAKGKVSLTRVEGDVTLLSNLAEAVKSNPFFKGAKTVTVSF